MENDLSEMVTKMETKQNKRSEKNLIKKKTKTKNLEALTKMESHQVITHTRILHSHTHTHSIIS